MQKLSLPLGLRWLGLALLVPEPPCRKASHCFPAPLAQEHLMPTHIFRDSQGLQCCCWHPFQEAIKLQWSLAAMERGAGRRQALKECLIVDLASCSAAERDVIWSAGKEDRAGWGHAELLLKEPLEQKRVLLSLKTIRCLFNQAGLLLHLRWS